MKNNLAWHFVGETLRDGQHVPADGEWLEHTGRLKLCESGLHFSREPFDALTYAPGATLCLVEIGGKIVEPKGEDKGICTRRKIIARMDSTELLRYFARMQALSVIHLNEDLCNSEVVCDYLMTGDASLRAPAWASARAAAGAPAWAPAWAAAGASAWASAWAAAWAAAGAPAGAPAWASARAAAGASARASAWAAAWAAAGASAWASALDAARAAALDTAWDAARKHFNDLVRESFSDFL